MKAEDLPATAGTYALLLQMEQEQNIQIGALGRFLFYPGYYIYLGSAFGPGGVRGRLGHHLRPVHSPRWHIDYLRSAANLIEIWYTLDPQHREHEWAQAAACLPAASIPIPRFGASDCRCAAHLYDSPIPCAWDDFCAYLKLLFPGHAPIHCVQI